MTKPKHIVEEETTADFLLSAPNNWAEHVGAIVEKFPGFVPSSDTLERDGSTIYRWTKPISGSRGGLVEVNVNEQDIPAGPLGQAKNRGKVTLLAKLPERNYFGISFTAEIEKLPTLLASLDAMTRLADNIEAFVEEAATAELTRIT